MRITRDARANTSTELVNYLLDQINPSTGTNWTKDEIAENQRMTKVSLQSTDAWYEGLSSALTSIIDSYTSDDDRLQKLQSVGVDIDFLVECMERSIKPMLNEFLSTTIQNTVHSEQYPLPKMPVTAKKTSAKSVTEISI